MPPYEFHCSLPEDHPLRNFIGTIVSVEEDKGSGEILLFYEDGRELSLGPDEHGDIVLWLKEETKH